MDFQLKGSDREWAETIFEKLNAKLKAECIRLGNTIPYIAKDGHYSDIDTGESIYWWTNGFWPGMLWQMYHATKETGDPRYSQIAQCHADTALNVIARPDGSCNHIVVLSVETGE